VTQDIARRVFEIEAAAILDLVPRLDQSFDHAVELLFACTSRVVVTGMGKSGLISNKISATFASTGHAFPPGAVAPAGPRRSTSLAGPGAQSSLSGAWGSSP
jgi:hypothetical protein